MSSIHFSGNFRLVANGQPIISKSQARQAMEVLQNVLHLNGATDRLQKPSWDLMLWQGKRPTGSNSGDSATEFRTFTEETLKRLKTGEVTIDALLAEPLDGDIEVTQLLHPTIAQKLFPEKTYHIDTLA